MVAYADAKAANGIPMGLTAGGTVLQDVAKDEMLTERNFTPDRSQFVYKLRQLQDALPER